jgi:hypothetical protein
VGAKSPCGGPLINKAHWPKIKPQPVSEELCVHEDTKGHKEKASRFFVALRGSSHFFC